MAEVAAARAGRVGWVVIAVGLFAVGCSSAAPQAQLGPPKASVVEALPVPARAVFLVGKRDRFGEYGLPSGVSLPALNAWSDEHLPRHRPWMHWAWCPLGHVHGPGVGSSIWSRQGDGLSLDLVTTSVAGRSRFTEALHNQALVCS
jgi:hypothetical protein